MGAPMTDEREELSQLMAMVHALPPMTLEERIRQKISFVYGNLAASTNHRPTSRAAVASAVWEKAWREARDTIAYERRRVRVAWEILLREYQKHHDLQGIAIAKSKLSELDEREKREGA